MKSSGSGKSNKPRSRKSLLGYSILTGSEPLLEAEESPA